MALMRTSHRAGCRADRKFKRGFGAMVRKSSSAPELESAMAEDILHQTVTDLWENGAAWFLDGVGTVESLETMRVRVVCYPNPNKATPAYAVASPKKP